MFYLDVLRMCENRGVENPVKFLAKNGFTYSVAHRMVNNVSDSLQYKHIEKLCLLFQCTPNDLLGWVPPDKSDMYKNQPLQKLNRGARKGNINQQIKKIPADRIDEFREFVESLTKPKNDT